MFHTAGDHAYSCYMTAVSDRIGGDRPVFSVEFFPVTVLISPKEGLQATGHGMTYRPCYP